MDDLISYRHVSYDEYDDDIDFNRFKLTQSKEEINEDGTDFLSSNGSRNLNVRLNINDQNSHEGFLKPLDLNSEIQNIDKLHPSNKQLNLNLDSLLKDSCNFEKKLPVSNSFSSGKCSFKF